MHKLLLVLLGVLLLACGGSDPASPSVPGGGDGDPVTPAVNPLVGTWTVTELEITTADNETMSLSRPNVSGSAAFDSTTLAISASVLGVPTVQESGSYTFSSTVISLTDQSSGGARTWDYTISGNVLILSGSRDAGGEILGLKITASR